MVEAAGIIDGPFCLCGFVFPVSVFIQVLLQEIKAQDEEQGVVHLAEDRDKVGKKIKGAEDVGDGYGEQNDGPKGHVPVLAFPIVPDQGKEQLEVTGQASKKPHP
jgi:hypothetical protein